MMEVHARDIVEFWLGPSVTGPQAAEARRAVWYEGGAELDEQIRARFGAHVSQAREGALEGWSDVVQGALALVILLDQFTRNIFRSTPEAYSGDALAMQIAERAVSDGSHRDLPVTGRIFLYHPFHHAESLPAQDRAVALVDAIRHDQAPEWHEYLDRRVAGFARHQDIIVRFGRFPHRNAVLGRASTDREAAFLAAEHDKFGQG